MVVLVLRKAHEKFCFCDSGGLPKIVNTFVRQFHIRHQLNIPCKVTNHTTDFYLYLYLYLYLYIYICSHESVINNRRQAYPGSQDIG